MPHTISPQTVFWYQASGSRLLASGITSTPQAPEKQNSSYKINTAKGKPGKSRGRKAEDLRRLCAMIVWLPKPQRVCPLPRGQALAIFYGFLGYQDTGFRYTPW